MKKNGLAHTRQSFFAPNHTKCTGWKMEHINPVETTEKAPHCLFEISLQHPIAIASMLFSASMPVLPALR